MVPSLQVAASEPGTAGRARLSSAAETGGRRGVFMVTLGLAPRQHVLHAEQRGQAHTRPALSFHGQLSGSTCALDCGVTSVFQATVAAGTH